MKFSNYNLIIDDNSLPVSKYLLCNTISGETFLIGERLKSIIDNKELSKLNEGEVKNFISSGVILENDEVDEALIQQYFHEKEKYTNDVLNLTILLTMACNLRCVYCYEAAGISSNEFLSDETRNNIFEFIKSQTEARRSKHVALWLFGGEPLLNFENNIDFLDKTQKYCTENDLQFSTYIVTNGTLINQDILETLVKYNCQYIQITLDGLKEIHDKRRIDSKGKGSFDETLKGIKLVVKENRLPNPVIRINIDKTNYKVAENLLEYLKNEELECCSIDFGIVKGSTPACVSYTGNCFLEEELGEILDPLWKKSKQLGFETGYTPSKRNMFCGLYSDSSFTIAPNGDLYKCWDFVNDEKHKIGRIGAKGKYLDTTVAYYQWMTRSPYNIEECRSCVYLPTCGGGCTGISYSKYGDYNKPGCYKVKSVFNKQIVNKFKGLLKI
jgi:uncharacterized protein